MRKKSKEEKDRMADEQAREDIATFRELITILEGLGPEYDPPDEDLKVESLKAKLKELEDIQDACEKVSVRLKEAAEKYNIWRSQAVRTYRDMKSSGVSDEEIVVTALNSKKAKGATEQELADLADFLEAIIALGSEQDKKAKQKQAPK